MSMARNDERHIRSFVRRQGKITVGQRKARLDLAAKWVLSKPHAPIDFQALFGNQNPVVLEIGFGMGEATATIAQKNPLWNFLGIEVYPAGIGALLQRIETLSLHNIRIIEDDAVTILRQAIAPLSLHAAHIFFPDPWPKKRHHKRRIIQGEFVSLLASRIAPEGYLHCATDWPEYANQMLQVLSAEPWLRNHYPADGFAERPDWRPQTKFESRGLRLGHPIADLCFRKRSSPPSPAAK
jgi:tRNA (guanine-N7-)-methyltransferase